MPYDAREIANFFLDYADKKKRPVTIMTLLKLIYFAHGWHLVNKGVPLVKNRFEAWQHGPVVRAVYDQFRDSKDSPITKRAHRFDPITQVEYEAEYSFEADCRLFLQQIFDAYAHLHAYALSNATHEAGSPWDCVWNNPDGKVTPGMQISDEQIKAHFLSIASRNVRH